jgi:hypothetical protein
VIGDGSRKGKIVLRAARRVHIGDELFVGSPQFNDDQAESPHAGREERAPDAEH